MTTEKNIIVRETLETIISTIDDAINLDFVTYQFFEKLKILPLRIIENTDRSIAKQLCQKKPREQINNYMERISSHILAKEFPDWKINMNYDEKSDTTYCSSDSSYRVGKYVVHLDNKGVQTKQQSNNISYEEMFKDHLPYNLHFKNSQSTLDGFVSRINKKSVIYHGTIPKSTTSTIHLCFILKHVYNDKDGLVSFTLYSIPHHSQMFAFQDLQYEQKKNGSFKKRPAKMIQEFLFNMLNRQGNPYTFLHNKEPRYFHHILKK